MQQERHTAAAGMSIRRTGTTTARTTNACREAPKSLSRNAGSVALLAPASLAIKPSVRRKAGFTAANFAEPTMSAASIVIIPAHQLKDAYLLKQRER